MSDRNLEQQVFCFLIDNYATIVPTLPASFSSLYSEFVAQKYSISFPELSKGLFKLSTYFPNSVVVHQYGCSEFLLEYYDVEVLRLWIGSFTSTGQEDPTAESPSYSNPEEELMDCITDNSSFLSNLSGEMLDMMDRSTEFHKLAFECISHYAPKKFIQICGNPSRNECVRSGNLDCLRKIHFEPIITSTTDKSLGDCSYLDTCYKGKGCKYLHYKIVYPETQESKKSTPVPQPGSFFTIEGRSDKKIAPAQWINCDIRQLDLSILGQFSVIIADPPWDIHMNGHLQLPYGVITDEDFMNFKMEVLQEEGLFFLWVTGRALDVGRQCLKKWGYNHIEEIIWCKINQLGRTICTGRTGHWLNHSKEHVLMGVKGNPNWLLRNFDVDVIVSATRDKSHKPDELYDVAERLAGRSSRKLELFGRAHNRRDGWLTVGNQLETNHLVDKQLEARYLQWKSKQTPNR
ncbi:N6-adenosine-methyltransferase Ime4p [Trichomonascus vanleenenianus]|uniref:mRNA (N6-adenosine)-methyltransferase n=1 Tax=Trichomonascus vanleenenianus TaxID=2268995 RepID=UPI003ECB5C7F